MIYRIDGSFQNRLSPAQLFIYPVVELNGIVYSDSNHNGKSGKRNHAHGYMKKTHGPKGPDYSEQDYRQGEEGPSDVSEEQ
ncbi:MAG: hypothetical protein A4E46_00319 [Methanosaeta sp. PtaU1.Bin016]|nr:MAG: hypothetical protein A4E46_00319 [Methanosaeta sp. PtaU1.Bin016]